MTETINDILAQMRKFVNEATVGHSFALAGIRHMMRQLGDTPRTPENPDPMVYVGSGDPNDPATKTHGSLRLSEALAQAAPGGPIETTLGQQWIVSVYSAWDEGFRPRIAAARGLARPADVTVPLFGDLRRLRHDVIHNGGIASQEYTGRCEVVAHWFSPGDTISLEAKHFVEFNDLVPWEELGTDVKGEAPDRS